MPLAPLQFIDSNGTDLSFSAEICVETEIFLIPGAVYFNVEIQAAAIDDYESCFFADSKESDIWCSFDIVIELFCEGSKTVTDDTNFDTTVNIAVDMANISIEIVVVQFVTEFFIDCDAEWITDGNVLNSWSSGVVF